MRRDRSTFDWRRWRLRAGPRAPEPTVDPYFAFDREELAARGRRMRDRFLSADPFPHAVLDEFFPQAVARRLAEEFPSPESFLDESAAGEDRRRGKFSSTPQTPLPGFVRHVLYHLNSATVIGFLQELSGIAPLLPDPDVTRALRHFGPGGRLGLHADPSYHGGLGLDRRLNLLVYLTPDWQPEWQGALELWDEELEACRSSIEPRFNRCVVFLATDRTFHGFPRPLACGPGITRRSMQLYYYTAGRPDGEVEGRHGTLFLGEGPGGPFRPPG